jgi:hypothetical protein
VILKICDFKNLDAYQGLKYSLLLPHYSAVLEEGWDWTNYLWCMNRQKAKPILEVVSKAGLYVLPEV